MKTFSVIFSIKTSMMFASLVFLFINVRLNFVYELIKRKSVMQKKNLNYAQFEIKQTLEAYDFMKSEEGVPELKKTHYDEIQTPISEKIQPTHLPSPINTKQFQIIEFVSDFYAYDCIDETFCIYDVDLRCNLKIKKIGNTMHILGIDTMSLKFNFKNNQYLRKTSNVIYTNSCLPSIKGDTISLRFTSIRVASPLADLTPLKASDDYQELTIDYNGVLKGEAINGLLTFSFRDKYNRKIKAQYKMTLRHD